jgi:membrane protease YdiL (CAAX protease family)
MRCGKAKKVGTPQLSINKIQRWLIPVIIVGTLALIIPLSESSAWIPMPNWVQKLFEKSFTTNIFSVINMVIAAPILEEVLGRGIILKGLLKNYSPIKAIIVSAIFFSLIHLNPWQSIPAFLNGVFLGWVYYKTRSVIPGMIIHATVNTTATAFLFLLPNNNQDLLNLWGTSVYLIACLASILVFTVICILINKKALIIPEALFRRQPSDL